MTRAANYADPAAARMTDEDVERLIDRLTSHAADVVFFPVRHHSPVCAALVAELVEHMRPAAVLIEGPSDFNERIEQLRLPHELPISIYSYFRREGRHHGAYYPFCEYSPEWTALHAGWRVGSQVRFIDLPWTDVASPDAATHRYADAELRRGRYVQSLCARLQVEDFDDLWDKLVESQTSLSLNDYLRRVHSLCFHIRLWDDSVSQSDRRREAFMAEQIRGVRRETAGQLLVVTGGYHGSALAARLERLECPGVDDGDGDLNAAEQPNSAISESGLALTTYSYERLDNLAGYNAGMPSPGFYDHAWRQRLRGETFDHRPLLVELAQALRERKQTVSTADLIAVETSARALAALRGRMHVWRRDLIDAVASSLIKDELEYGCESPFISAVHAVLRGDRRGRLAEGTPMPPLALDIRSQLAAAELAATSGMRTIELDLLSPSDLQKSRLLHRLKVLGIVGYDHVAGTDFLLREDLAKLWEAWRIRWSPDFESMCVEASRYGTSLAEAAAARLSEAAREHPRDAAAAAELLVQAARAGIETLSDSLLEQLSQLIAEEARFPGAAGALEHILFLYCHDEAFGTSRLPQVGRLLVETFSRSLWLLEMLGRTSGEDAKLLRGMRALLETFERGGAAVELDRDELIAVMVRVERDTRKPSSVRGAAAGILWVLGDANEEQVLADLLLFAAPTELGDFLAGLFALAREVAQRHARLVQMIDRLLNEFNADDFQTSLPSLRMAFTYFTPREKHYMLTTLFESLGLRESRPLPQLTVGGDAAAEALALEERLFETIAKYGLEERRE